MQMTDPLISVLLPVYNSAPFLGDTLRAILNQTEGNFELLVLNDGSTDDTEAVIHSFSDSRIRYFRHPNTGLIGTLNRGLQEARGKYIARIDGDDICLPERFAKQAAWLDAHPETAVAGCFVTFIDEQGKETGIWEDDRACHTAQQIKDMLPQKNVIAHPGIMARAEVLKEYKYNGQQQHIEDYDLWLRLLSDGKIIEKVPEALLLYRVHSASITAQNIKKKNIFYKQAKCKWRFLQSRNRWNAFDRKVFRGMLRDLFTGTGKWFKQKI